MKFYFFIRLSTQLLNLIHWKISKKLRRWL